MNEFSGFTRASPATADMSVDVGLRNFMLGVYNKMALGLVLTGILAFVVGMVPEVRQLFFTVEDGRLSMTLLGFLMKFAPLAIIFGAMFFMKDPSPQSSGIMYWVLVSAIGITSGYWFIVYQMESLAQVFFITAASFGALSLWGYTTKKDLSGWGSFLIMGLFGMIIASLVNVFFVKSGVMQLAISAIGVLIFAGLTAFDTQNLKMTYYALGGNQRALGVATNFGALNMYLNFINLFQLLLSIFGSRR